MKLNLQFWLKFSLINLCIVASLGVLMRYKIGFEFPFFNQKNILHSHSHFAFAGWITHTLMIVMVYYLKDNIDAFNLNKYKKVIIANLICAYGMLIFFIIQGYGMVSIFFSTASIFASYAFGYYYIKDLKKIDSDLVAINWFRAAAVFNIISSFGTFYLAYMMATKNIIQDLYLSSIYYFLHFQYNGWFFFACMGLFLGFLKLKKSDNPFYDTSFKLFAIACIPAYFLSILWLKIPIWIYIITVIAAIIQVFAWFKLVFIIAKEQKEILKDLVPILRYILVFVSLALSIKLILQLGSTIPALSQLAFGFRPIVIAYLHLVLLAVISLFLLFYIYLNHFVTINKNIKKGLFIFSIGVFLNELVLAIQGVTSLSYTIIPYVNELLFAIALLLLLGIGTTTFYSIKKVKNNADL